MAKFCTHCGTQFNDNIKFCPNRGAAVAAPAPAQRNITQYTASGFSDRVNHPEILAALKKNRKTARVFAFFLLPFPVIGAVLYALVSKKTDVGQAATYGGSYRRCS